MKLAFKCGFYHSRFYLTEPPKPPAKNFFMDIYAQEVNKMKSESTSAPVSKKRNFDATHFNAYGLPLGE